MHLLTFLYKTEFWTTFIWSIFDIFTSLPWHTTEKSVTKKPYPITSFFHTKIFILPILRRYAWGLYKKRRYGRRFLEVFFFFSSLEIICTYYSHHPNTSTKQGKVAAEVLSPFVFLQIQFQDNLLKFWVHFLKFWKSTNWKKDGKSLRSFG